MYCNMPLNKDTDYDVVQSVVEATQQHRDMFVYDN